VKPAADTPDVTRSEPSSGENERVSLDEARIGAKAADRLVFFSDAVVAIAITLLALELPVPVGHTADVFWDSVRHNSSEYVAFIVSFLVIASSWTRHFQVMRYLENCDSYLRTLDMMWLLAIIVNPFATKLLTRPGQDSLIVHALCWGFYALLQVALTITFLLMVRHLTAVPALAPDLPRETVAPTHLHSLGFLVGFGLSIPVFFLTREAWVLWIAGPLVIGQGASYRRRRQRARDSSTG
jgi:uncharacterized membrane protein